MTVKLILLKSGEDIISDIQEMVLEDKVIGYFFQKPYSVKVFATDNELQDNLEKSCRLQLSPWMPLTSDNKIPVPSDWVVTIVEPIIQLKETYQNTITKRSNINETSN